MTIWCPFINITFFQTSIIALQGFEVYSKCLEPTSKTLNLLLDGIPAPISRINNHFTNLKSDMQNKILKKSSKYDESSPSSISHLDKFDNFSPSKHKNTSPSFETWQTFTFTPPSSPHYVPPTVPSHEDDEWDFVKNDIVKKDFDTFVIVDECKYDSIGNSDLSNASLSPESPVSCREEDRGSGPPVPVPVLPVTIISTVTAVASLLSKFGVVYNE